MPDTAATAVLFPGQGAALGCSEQLVLAVCPDLHRRACGLIGSNPFERACDSTRFAQPAIFLAGVAGFSRASAAGVVPAAFAGHSLGEITALAAAGAWSAERALELVVLRASLMADAGDAGAGGMLALLKAGEREAAELAARFGVTVANDNAPGQIVLSGDREALRSLSRLARARGLRTIELGVSGAFHSPAMAPAVAPLARALRAAPADPPLAPVYSCLTAQPFEDPAAELPRALCSPVRWRETIQALAHHGIERFLDVGPDAVLAGLVRRIVPAAKALSIEDVLGAPA